MRRAVITGIGIVSSLGNNAAEVLASLKAGKSGITYSEQFEQQNLRSRVWGNIKLDVADLIDRKVMRFMGDAAAYAYLSMQQAIADAKLTEEMVSNPRTGLVAGSGGASSKNQIEACDTLREKGVRRVGPYMVPRTMSSTTSACLATPFKIKGINYSISSACATSSHCIGNALEQIQLGKQDIVFAGGGEEVDWTLAMQFDAMGALSSKYNDTPEKASRTYDAGRDGFVISGGGGIVVVEELEHALARGAHIYAEVVGYGTNSDAYHITSPAPHGEFQAKCMQLALDDAGLKAAEVDYVNAHGTSTHMNDQGETEAIKAVWGDAAKDVSVSSIKSMTGHLLGAAGGAECIATALAIENDMLPPTINYETQDEGLDLDYVPNKAKAKKVRAAMSNSFGFGGHNACLLLKKYAE